MYKLNADREKSEVVYKETHPNAFYDSMEFWNDQEGLAIGDPTEECMSIIITRDGGESWNKISCDNLPKVIEVKLLLLRVIPILLSLVIILG